MKTITRIGSAGLLASALLILPSVAMAQTDQGTDQTTTTATAAPGAMSTAAPGDQTGGMATATPGYETTMTTTTYHRGGSGWWGWLGLIGLLGLFGLAGGNKSRNV